MKTRRRRPGQAARDAANRALDALAREAFPKPVPVQECRACFATFHADRAECPTCEVSAYDT